MKFLFENELKLSFDLSNDEIINAVYDHINNDINSSQNKQINQKENAFKDDLDIVLEQKLDVVPGQKLDVDVDVDIDIVPEQKLDVVPEQKLGVVPEQKLDNVLEKNVNVVSEKTLDNVQEKTLDVVKKKEDLIDNGSFQLGNINDFSDMLKSIEDISNNKLVGDVKIISPFVKSKTISFGKNKSRKNVKRGAKKINNPAKILNKYGDLVGDIDKIIISDLSMVPDINYIANGRCKEKCFSISPVNMSLVKF